MVKVAEKIIYIQDHQGNRFEFDPVALQTRLINCFLTAGLQENGYMAEDIALAVEYTLLNSDRPEAVFGQGELSAAVIRMLEETGLPEIAVLFRQTQGDQNIALDANPDSIALFLRKFLACAEPLFNRVTTEVTRAVKILGIKEADPHLYLEFARHYERKFALENIVGEPISKLKGRTAVSQAELSAASPPEIRELEAAGILRINAISEIFPRIRFFFIMKKFAEKFQLASPVTEMEIEPLLFQMGQTLELGRSAIENALQLPEPLPVQLSLPDMTQFVVEYLGVEPEKSRKLANELADTLCFEFKNEIYKLSVN
ncbi:MAG: hypothetical protein LBM70_10020 [Victivallales bacterium]|jgi:hypothetical protein|nr:hypothetical protein [Victivallales bacterium]